MKKKLLVLLLSLSCVLSMTACGSSEETSAKTQQAEKDREEEREEDQKSKEKAKEEKEKAEAEQKEAEETKKAEEKEKEEAKKETEENVEAKTASVTMPTELSDDIYDFQVSIDGTVYQFPMWYSDFEALGWEYEGDNTQTLSSNQYTLSERWKKGDFEVSTRFANLSMNTVTFAESMIASISLDKFDIEDSGWEIILPKGIKWGVSNVDDIKAAYGDPTSDYDGDMYYKMTYESDIYSEVSLYVYKDSNTLMGIEIENMVELEGADNSIDETVPDIVSNYKAPSSLSDDLYSFNVELEGKLYTLPCPVAELLANGFEIDEANSQMEIAAGSFGWVDLQYNNQTLHGMVYNYADYATIAENCFVTMMETNDYGPDFDMIIPGNIKRGDSEADVEKVVANFNFEKEVSDSGYTYYSVFDPEVSKFDGYTICVKDGVVINMEAKNTIFTE